MNETHLLGMYIVVMRNLKNKDCKLSLLMFSLLDVNIIFISSTQIPQNKTKYTTTW